MEEPLPHMLQRLREARLVTEPYAHFYLENVFPDDYYRTLLQHLPAPADYGSSLYHASQRKLEHYRNRRQSNLDADWVASLPPQLQDFWGGFNACLFSPALAEAALDSFAPVMHEQFGQKESWPAWSTEAQLACHRAGYFLHPHTDATSKLVVFLLYLASDSNHEHLGTSLYRPKDPGFFCPLDNPHPYENFIRVKRAPYRPNSLFAFFRTDRSFHGVEPLSGQSDGPHRELIQYVVFHREARQAEQDAS